MPLFAYLCPSTALKKALRSALHSAVADSAPQYIDAEILYRHTQPSIHRYDLLIFRRQYPLKQSLYILLHPRIYDSLLFYNLSSCYPAKPDLPQWHRRQADRRAAADGNAISENGVQEMIRKVELARITIGEVDREISEVR
jgi:hypothetical protein